MSTRFDDAESIPELLAQLVGAGSMCWERVSDAGVFQSDVASTLVDEATERLIELGWS